MEKYRPGSQEEQEAYYAEPERSIELVYTIKNAKRGKFKVAYMDGTVAGFPPPVVVKQCCLTTPEGKQQPYDGARQMQKLLQEVQCLCFAHALMNEVNGFIDRRLSVLGEDALSPQPYDTIPSMRFVKGYLAWDGTGPNGQAFLLEEQIPDKFVKYINNDTAIPFPTSDPDRTTRAEFLAFTQHAQYWLSGKLAYVSDYQGRLCCTSDVGRLSG